jgi:hypothetical protein
MNDSTDTPGNTIEVLPDNIAVITQRGYQNAETVNKFKPQLDAMTEKLHQEGKKSLILVDMSAVTGHDASARAAGEESIKGTYDALAVCGPDTTIRIIVNFLTQVTGMGDRVQFFKTKEESLEWLRSHLT